MRKTLKEERSLNEEMEEEDGIRAYQCQPQSLTYGDQFSDKNIIFQVRIAGGDRQCLTGFFPIRHFRLMCKNPGEMG
jgi:hypothetical protein